ncbi:ras guanine nucleotide exchange factor B-like [Portunus trituberculatus]|uniref:ras guanine nucleotide exchange factor B-like n=1 Tax=Portunus trituberculatus TaxID=210409 RepID=UPI001E1D08E7|nr:ras guanine nucleotide exchange factor B-like [Portunus trituberculatus]
MVITRSQGEADQLRGKLRLGPDTIPLQDTIEILGVEVDSRLQFDRHLEKVARNTSFKVNLLRRMKHLLHADGLLTLYKAQVRPIMEYAPLTWMSSARCHLSLLDKVQRRAERLISGATHHQQHHPHWWRRQQHRQPQQEQQQQQEQRQQEEQQRHDMRDSLEHRRRVAALTVLHKAQVQRVPHLTNLGTTWRRHEVGTRTVSANDLLLEVPRSHSSTHQRAFTSAAVVWWNELTTDVDVRGLSTQQIKVAAHRWLRLHPP